MFQLGFRVCQSQLLLGCKWPRHAGPRTTHLQRSDRITRLHPRCNPFSSASTPSSRPGQKVHLWHNQSTRKSAVVTHGLLSPQVINQPFLVANSVVCIPWLLMILRPRWNVTERIFRSNWSIIVSSFVFAFFFVTAALIDVSSPDELIQKVKFLFIDAITDPSKMQEMLSSGPAYAAQDWIHLIAWDLIGGRWIYLDGLDKKVPTQLSLAATFTGGPLGLLVHLLVCKLSNKKFM